LQASDTEVPAARIIADHSLEQGRFLSDWCRATTREMDWTGLKLLLEGIEAQVVRRRYRHPIATMPAV
jgi:transposase